VDNKLDRLIDGALAGYAEAEPLAGLEERVLRRVHVAKSRRRRLFAWALGIGLAAAAAIVAIVMETRPAPVVRTVDVARVTPPQPQPVMQQPLVRPQRARVIRGRARPVPLPKLEQFPAPTPLTQEERALMAFVHRDPKEAEQVFGELRKQADQPIEIQPIEIAPLRSDEAQ